MAGRAGAGGGKGQRLLLGQRLGELRHRRIRRLGRHDQRQRHHRGERDRHQVLLGAVGEPLDPVLIDGDLAGLAHQQRVTIGRRRHHGLRADGAGRAGAVLDDDGLAERFAKRHRDEARHDVAGAARRISDDDVDGTVREVLRGGREHSDDQSRQNEAKPNEHFLVSSGGDCRGRGWRCPGAMGAVCGGGYFLVR